MPINDTNVDLTANRTFRDKDMEFLRMWCRRTEDKLFIGKKFYTIRPPLINKAIRRLEIPWVRKESEVVSDNKVASRRKRSYDDPFSDSLQVTFRTTSSNTFLQFGEPNNIIRNADVLEEIFLEEYGYIPLSSVTRCFECGRHIIHPVGEVCMSCNRCARKLRKIIPWAVR